LIGTEISHYRVLELLGRGGMGEVYLAEDLNLRRRVALKTLPPEMAADADRLERFRREAQTLAALDHPAIVTIHSVEEAEGVHLIAMQLVKGRTLDQLIPDGGMSLPELFKVALPLSDALAAAHEAGVTHRDLKPTNVMVTDDGQVKVLDFGLAKLEGAGEGAPDESARTLTEEGQVFGTVPYMSPEQVSGQGVDQRSDIFSLGVILYEMATGRRPFAGDTQAHLVSSILRDKPDSVTSLKAELPHHLGRIVNRCLEKEPRKRYQAALDVHNELEGLQQEVESGVLRTSSHAISATALRRGAKWWPIAAGAVVVLAAAGFLWLGSRQEPGARSGSEGPAAFQQMKITQLTASGNALEAAISPDGRYVVHLEEKNGKTSLHVLQVTTGSRVEIVPPSEIYMWDPVFSPDGEYVYLVMTPDRSGDNVGDLYRLPVLGGAPQRILPRVSQRVSFSPDGKRFAFMRSELATSAEELLVVNADGSGERLVKSTSYPEFFFQDPSWWPKGDLIAAPLQRFKPETRVAIVGVDVESGELRPLTDETWFNLNELAWYPDGAGLVMSAGKEGHFANKQIWELSHPAGSVRRVTNDLNDYNGVSLTGDGASLVTVLVEVVTNIWTADETGAASPAQRTQGRERNGNDGVAAAPDGTILYTSSGGRLWRLPPDDAAPRRFTQTDEVQVEPEISPDGRYVVYTSDAAGTVNVWRRDFDGGNPVQLTRGIIDYGPIFSPDSRWVLFESEERLYRVSVDGGEPLQITDRRIGDRPAVSPDGSLVAAETYDPESERWLVDIFPFEGGEPLQTVDLPPFDDLAWSADGEAIVYSDDSTEVQNLWRMPLDGGPPQQITHFDSQRIIEFDTLPGGGGFVLSRGTVTSDVVLLENFR